MNEDAINHLLKQLEIIEHHFGRLASDAFGGELDKSIHIGELEIQIMKTRLLEHKITAMIEDKQSVEPVTMNV